MDKPTLSLIKENTRLVDKIISDAIRCGASDVHIELDDKRVRIRYRIDGDLQEINSLPKELHPSIVSRIKILSNLNIAEHRFPQDGSYQNEINNQKVDLRISIIPTIYGEKVVIRILDPDRIDLNLIELGFEEDSMKLYLQAITSVKNGIILITGPSGSGKSTTLFSTLNTIINSPTKNIITIEDPVEYRLPGINQIELKPTIGLDFKTISPSILRQDPDIILISEIRNEETAKMAINIALTGHLVFSTLHTNDAVGTITRLLNLGIEPFLIGETLRCIVSQRLVRRICPNCKIQTDLTPEIVKIIKEFIPNKKIEDINLVKGKGCPNCFQTGNKGRIGIFEIIPITATIKELILNNTSVNKLRNIGKKEGLRTLREDGMCKVIRGITTIEEVLRVTQE